MWHVSVHISTFLAYNPDSQFPGSPLVLTVTATSVPATVTNTQNPHHPLLWPWVDNGR